MRPRKLLEALGAANTRRQLSLDEPIGDDTDTSLSDLLPAPKPSYEPEDVLALRDLLAALPDLDRSVIIMGLFEGPEPERDRCQDRLLPDACVAVTARAVARIRAQLVEPDHLHPVSPREALSHPRNQAIERLAATARREIPPCSG